MASKHDEALETAINAGLQAGNRWPAENPHKADTLFEAQVRAFLHALLPPETKGLVERLRAVGAERHAGNIYDECADALEALTAKCAVLEAERDQARGELRMVDELLARRPALADSDGRIAKIGKAISYAGRTDAAERENAQLRARASRIREETI